jgi:hypothetical protein
MKIAVHSLAVSLALLLYFGCRGEQPKEAQQQPAETGVQEYSEVDTIVPPPVVEVPAKEAEQPKTTTVSKPASQKNVTVTGEVIDIIHYAATGARASTPEGREVIESGAKRGDPLGILESGTGDVYLVTMKQANTPAGATLLPFLGMKVTAKGDVYRKGGQQLLVLSVVGKSIK